MGKLLKNLFLPSVGQDVQKEIDKTNVRNVNILSWIVFCIETTILLVFLLITRQYDQATLTSLFSVLFCIIVCLSVALVSHTILKKKTFPHLPISLMNDVYFLLLIAWGIVVSYWHYLDRSDNLLTFFSIIVCIICFISYRPIKACLWTFFAYAGLYLAFLFADGAQSINLYNYLVLMILSAVSMVMRYFQQVKIASKALQLTYISRHDELTGLRNRQAFEEDLPKYLNRQITVIMSDIDYFKKINDTYGHLEGDRILREVGLYIKQHFPTCHVYRYGGDEFLIFFRGDDATSVKEATAQHDGLSIPMQEGTFFARLSYGVSGGMAEDTQALMAIIADADKKLYRIKRQIHKDDAIV